ncbi:alanine aminotransferase 2-like [Nematolebias whitei]|uniref:alanine aminotransferase 2-like n=1 Tax=Nematolebias whitei TaxID=451745 RepID=UPI00189AE430|nr:alanine aminotransferase 2-like [Nematolebias whitei]
MSSLRDVNPRVRGIRTPVDLQGLAARITEQLSQGEKKSFKDVIDVSSGDSHSAGMKPVTFLRQVLAVCLYPQLLRDERFPSDVRLRAQRLLEACDGESVGSYADSSGLLHIRQRISEFITKRDAGVPASSRNIFVSSGAQRAQMVVVKLLSTEEGQTPAGVLTPLPCPHTLPALLDEAGVMSVSYLLEEERQWAVDLKELRRALTACRGRCLPRAIYICNPGNPTGHVQDRKLIREVIKFAAAEKLLLLVDEVYQDSVYAQNQEFISYKKVLFEMGPVFRENVELVSFHSLSCACVAECGLRAGFMEVINMDPEVTHFVDTLLCTDISTPVTGQLALDLMLHPPRPGDPSYDTHAQETGFVHATLIQNAERALKVLNDLPGMRCQPAMGGIYLYPCLLLPEEMRQEAETMGLEADVWYRLKLQEEEGLVVGAGGAAGSHHLRLSILVPADTLEEVLSRLSSFHLRLMNLKTEERHKKRHVFTPHVPIEDGMSPKLNNHLSENI